MDSLTDFVAALSKTSTGAAGEPLWYRGSGAAKYKLTPSLFRHPTTKSIEDILEMEARLLSRFKQRSVPFLPGHKLEDDWEYLFLMQHYDVPTRLLDWSENAWVALWFSLTSRAVNPEYASVWVLNPGAWNRSVFKFQGFKGGVLSVTDLQLEGYKPGSTSANMNRAPAAIYGTHNSPRIVAQRGVFTISGTDVTPLEDLGDPSALTPGLLDEIRVTEAKIPSVLKELRDTGFTESMIFPDLQGLARELSALEGF